MDGERRRLRNRLDYSRIPRPISRAAKDRADDEAEIRGLNAQIDMEIFRFEKLLDERQPNEALLPFDMRHFPDPELRRESAYLSYAWVLTSDGQMTKKWLVCRGWNHRDRAAYFAAVYNDTPENKAVLDTLRALQKEERDQVAESAAGA